MANEKQTESVKIKSNKVDIVRAIKEKTGTPIGRLIEDAIDHKYSKEGKKQ